MATAPNRTLATRYVHALAPRQAAPALQDRLGKELGEWAAAAETGPLASLIANPTLPRAAQAAVLRDLAATHGASKKMQDLLGLLAESRRLGLLSMVAEIYMHEVREARGQKVAEVVSARPLTEAQKQEVQKAVGNDTEIAYREDSSLLGGLVLHQGGKTLDLSVEAQLERARRALLAAA